MREISLSVVGELFAQLFSSFFLSLICAQLFLSSDNCVIRFVLFDIHITILKLAR